MSAVVELSNEEIEALRREATGQSVMAHTQLEDEAEEFWGHISNKLERALAAAKKFGNYS